MYFLKQNTEEWRFKAFIQERKHLDLLHARTEWEYHKKNPNYCLIKECHARKPVFKWGIGGWGWGRNLEGEKDGDKLSYHKPYQIRYHFNEVFKGICCLQRNKSTLNDFIDRLKP